MINKSIFFHFALVMICVVATAQKPFTIDGTIKGKNTGNIYLSGGVNPDSSVIKDGHFSFHGVLDGPTQVMVTTDRNSRSFDSYAQLYIVPGTMQLSLDNSNFSDGAVLKGSPEQTLADELKNSKGQVMEQVKPLRQAYDKANELYIEAIKAKKDEATLSQLKEAADKAKEATEPYYQQLSDIDKDFMDKHPSSFVTASLLRYRISSMTLQEGEERFAKLPESIKKSSLGQDMRKDLDGLRMGSPGAKAFVFSSTELRGGPVSLADYKGKYVLLDFWASWCVPCRKGNPHLLSVYSKYKDKGFEIIGVSDDDGNPAAWQKAVEKDNIGVWKHILRGLKRVEGPKMYDMSASISDRFGIHTLPTKILIDPNGTIIGRYGGGGESDEAMDKKLSEIFGG